jgi:hypothetical protein
MLYKDRRGNKYSILPLGDHDRLTLGSIPGLGTDLMALKGLMNESGLRGRTPVCIVRDSSYSGGSLPEGEKTARLLCAIPGVREVFYVLGKGHGKYVNVKPVEEMTDAELRGYSHEFQPEKGSVTKTRTRMSFPMLKRLKDGVASSR